MEARVRKWGNSLAIRIPKPFASEVGLHPDTEVELQVNDGRLVIIPHPKPSYSLSDLLAYVRRSNLHGEVEPGSPVGREKW